MDQRWTPAYYRAKAKRALEEANSTALAARRRELLEIARHWDLLAADLERQLEGSEGSLPPRRRRRRSNS